MSEETNTPETDTQAKPVLRFKRFLKEEPFELEDNFGEVMEYVIREMTSPERDKYLGQHASRYKVNAEGMVVGVKDFKGIQSSLISKCCFTKGGAKVSQQEIDNWPPTVQSALYKLCQEINCLTEKSEEDEKKE